MPDDVVGGCGNSDEEEQARREAVGAELRGYRVSMVTIESLLAEVPLEQVERHLEQFVLRDRSTMRDIAACLVAAIRQDWEPPPAWLARQKQKAAGGSSSSSTDPDPAPTRQGRSEVRANAYDDIQNLSTGAGLTEQRWEQEITEDGRDPRELYAQRGGRYQRWLVARGFDPAEPPPVPAPPQEGRHDWHALRAFRDVKTNWIAQPDGTVRMERWCPPEWLTTDQGQERLRNLRFMLAPRDPFTHYPEPGQQAPEVPDTMLNTGMFRTAEPARAAAPDRKAELAKRRMALAELRAQRDRLAAARAPADDDEDAHDPFERDDDG